MLLGLNRFEVSGLPRTVWTPIKRTVLQTKIEIVSNKCTRNYLLISLILSPASNDNDIIEALTIDSNSLSNQNFKIITVDDIVDIVKDSDHYIVY